MNSYIIKEYQTLLAGLIALFCAAGTVIAIFHQIRSRETIAEQQRSRRSFATRSVLPNALTQLCSYADDSVTFMSILRREANQRRAPDQQLPGLRPPPEIPTDSVGIIRECIEHADQEPAKEMADLLSKLQIQNTRMVGTQAQLRANILPAIHSLDDYLLDALEIFARASALFEYARRETDEVPNGIDYENMTNAANLCGIREHEFRSVHERMVRY